MLLIVLCEGLGSDDYVTTVAWQQEERSNRPP
jgi:hypothetical protein